MKLHTDNIEMCQKWKGSLRWPPCHSLGYDDGSIYVQAIHLTSLHTIHAMTYKETGDQVPPLSRQTLSSNVYLILWEIIADFEFNGSDLS